jgi:hypothetical protein
VPILPALAAEIETWERAPGPFLLRLDGRPWRKDERATSTPNWLGSCFTGSGDMRASSSVELAYRAR